MVRSLNESGCYGAHLPSVVVTIREGSTFDDLFAKYPQSGPNGSSTSVCQADGVGLKNSGGKQHKCVKEVPWRRQLHRQAAALPHERCGPDQCFAQFRVLRGVRPRIWSAQNHYFEADGTFPPPWPHGHVLRLQLEGWLGELP